MKVITQKKLKEVVDKNVRMDILSVRFHKGNFDLGLPYLKDNRKILDFGCGAGYFYDYLKKLRFNVDYIGYDKAKYKENYDFPFYTDLKKIKDKWLCPKS